MIWCIGMMMKALNMGFLKNVLSSKQKEEEIEIRAEYKNQSFFEASLEQEKEMIKMLINSNEELQQNNKIEPFHFWNVATKYLRNVYLKYSINQKVSVIKKDYLIGLEYYIKGWDEEEATYSDMIAMVSLAILFEVSDAEINQLIEYVDKTERNSNLKDWKPDYVLGYLLHSRNANKVVPDTVLIPNLYQKIVDLTQLDKKEAQIRMKDYLEKWYELHKNDPWYDSHKRQWGYSGYWCWEAAAVVKVMGLDDTRFKDHPHYPYDMVHWNDDESA